MPTTLVPFETQAQLVKEVYVVCRYHHKTIVFQMLLVHNCTSGNYIPYVAVQCVC